MSKIKKTSEYIYRSYLNPLSDSPGSKYERTKSISPSSTEWNGSSLPMHLCHGSSVHSDVVDALRENVMKPVPRPRPMIRKAVDKENLNTLHDTNSNCDQHASKYEDAVLGARKAADKENFNTFLDAHNCNRDQQDALPGSRKAADKENFTTFFDVYSNRDQHSLKYKEDASSGALWCENAWMMKGHALQSSDTEGETKFCATPNHLHLWDGSEAAPAPSWSTIANRSLLCRPLPLDVGRCTCYIVHEHRSGPHKSSAYALYTDEGHGRDDRKLAVARHYRKVGRTEFVIVQSGVGHGSEQAEDVTLGTVNANLVGSRYHIWDQGDLSDPQKKDSRLLLGVVMFEPTVATLTGSFRKMRVVIPRYQSMLLNSTGFQHGNGLSKDWEENLGRVSQLFSRAPYFNRATKQYELDFRDRARVTSRIRSSVKNFQLTMEENGKQIVLQLGKISKSTYIMEYRFPLTGYQAFSICLASIDSKLCCTV